METVTMNGDTGDFLLVDKPIDWTSFDVVAKIRNTYSAAGLRRKVGHCGTLDPRATGLLILATGRKTKQISGLEALDKVYEGIIKLGAMTESHDTESPEYGACDVRHLGTDKIQSAAVALEGRRMQKPPMHSAVWHKGKRLYELARKGQDVPERKAREIYVNSFTVLSVDLPFVHFRMDVSKGSYIRVLAHEFGQILGVGGYLASLRRVAIGDFGISDAKSVSETVESILRGTKDSVR
jgi:tRNA pseudouridine55 synthase